MAKNANGWKSIAAIISACGLIGVIAGGLTSKAEIRATESHIIEDTTKAVEKLEVDGCDPANTNKTDIAVMDAKWLNIEEDVDGLQEDMKSLHVGQAAILQAIKEQ